jgi:predicted RNA-binding protein with RPS1 domain
MKVTLTQSSNGSIPIGIESSDVCTKIYTSSTFDPYEKLYIWLGQIRDSQLPTTMVIDEGGVGVELIAEKVSNDAVLFRIEPWFQEDYTTTFLATIVERQELIKVFHDGIVEFITNEYRPFDWSYIDNLSNTNWVTLLKPSTVSSRNWQKRLLISKLSTHSKGTNPEVDALRNQLTLEQEWLLVLQNILIEIAIYADRNKITQVKVLANLYKKLPIDILLNEIDPSWYQERRNKLNAEYGLDLSWWTNREQRERRQNLRTARLKTLKVGQVVDGTVFAVKPYGIFVNIGGYGALLHISAISQLTVEHPEQVFQRDDWVRAMIIWMDVERGRVSLSTSDLEPEPGDMLKEPLKVYEKAEEMAARYCQHVLSKQNQDSFTNN